MMQERRNAILQELNEYGKVKVADLSKKLECSEVTIRNDIKSMDKEGLLKRTHGLVVMWVVIWQQQWESQLYRIWNSSMWTKDL